MSNPTQPASIELVMVFSTAAHQAEAERLAEALVQRRLAACVQIVGPVVSRYWWQGQVDSASEWQLVAKTRRDLLPQVEQTFAELHSYQVPELVAVPILGGSAAYLRWLGDNLRPPTDRQASG